MFGTSVGHSEGNVWFAEESEETKWLQSRDSKGEGTENVTLQDRIG